MTLYFGERLVLVAMVVERGEEGIKPSRECSAHYDSQYNSGYPSGRSRLVDLFAHVRVGK